MLCQFQGYSRVIQLYMYTYLFFFRFFSHIGHYRVLSSVPCAIQQVLIRYLFYIEQCVYINSKLPIYPYLQFCHVLFFKPSHTFFILTYFLQFSFVQETEDCNMCSLCNLETGNFLVQGLLKYGLRILGGEVPETFSGFHKALPFPALYLCEVGFSSHTSAKTTYCNRLNAEAAIRIQLSSKSDIKEICINVEQCYSSH